MSHFTGSRWNKGLTSKEHQSIKKKDISEILIDNSGWTSHNLKLHLIKEGIKECKCERCNCTEWEGFQIPIKLHHINGNHKDNRLANLMS